MLWSSCCHNLAIQGRHACTKTLPLTQSGMMPWYTHLKCPGLATSMFIVAVPKMCTIVIGAWTFSHGEVLCCANVLDLVRKLCWESAVGCMFFWLHCQWWSLIPTILIACQDQKHNCWEPLRVFWECANCQQYTMCITNATETWICLLGCPSYQCNASHIIYPQLKLWLSSVTSQSARK